MVVTAVFDQPGFPKAVNGAPAVNEVLSASGKSQSAVYKVCYGLRIASVGFLTSGRLERLLETA